MAMTSEQARAAGKKSSRKGSKGIKTEQWEMFSAWCLEGGLKKFKKELNKLEGKDFINAYTQLLEFHKPKLQRSEIKAQIEGEIVTTQYVIDLTEDEKVTVAI